MSSSGLFLLTYGVLHKSKIWCSMEYSMGQIFGALWSASKWTLEVAFYCPSKDTRSKDNLVDGKKVKWRNKPKFTISNNRKITDMFTRVARTPARDPAPEAARNPDRDPLLRECAQNDTEYCRLPKGRFRKEVSTLTNCDTTQPMQPQLLQEHKLEDNHHPKLYPIYHLLDGPLD